MGGTTFGFIHATVLATALGLESSETGALADIIDISANEESGQMTTWWRFQAFLLAGSHVMLFAVANWFFAKLLYRDYEAALVGIEQRLSLYCFLLFFKSKLQSFGSRSSVLGLPAKSSLLFFLTFGGEAEIHPVSFRSNLCCFFIYVSVDAGDHGWFV